MPFDLSKLQAYTEIKEKPEKSESWDDLIESAFKTEPEKGLPQQVASGSNSQDTSAGQTKNMPAASDSWDDLISAAFKNESEMNTGSTPEATGLNDLKNRLVDFDKSNQAFLNEWDAKEKELEKVKKSFDPTKVNAVLSYLHENGGKRKQLKQEREELLSSIYNHPELIAERKEKAAELEKRMAEMDKLYDGSNVPVLGTGPGAYMMKGKKEQDAEREADRFSRAYKLYENAHDMLLAPSKFDKSNAFLNFAKGSGKVLSDKDFWTGGMSAIARNLDLGSIFKKISENKEGKDFKDLLTPGESSLLDAYYAQVNAQAERAKDLSLGYQAGQGAAQSLEYMAEFLATGGLATAASSGAKKAAMKWIIKHSAPASLKRQALKGAAWGAEAGVGTLARTPLMPSTYVNVTDPTRQFETDEKGNVLQDEAGRPVLKSGWKVFREGFVDSFIENLSEVSGGHIAGTLGVGGKIVGKVVPQGVREAFAKTGDWLAKSKPGEMYKSFSKSPVWKFLKEGGYNGLLEEWGEEWYGAALRSVLTDPSALKDYATLENQLVTVASFLPMSALGGGVATGQMLKAKGQYKQTLNALQGLMKDLGYKEDQVAYLTDQIEASDAEKMASTIAPLINTLAGENEEKAGELFTAVADFSRAKGNYHLMNGAYEERMAARKAAEDKRMEEETGGYVNSSTGRVEIVADEEGNTAYVAGESLDGDHKVYILNKGGEKISVSREDFEEGYKVQGNFDKDEFLGTIIMNRDLEEEISEEVSRVEDVQETQSEDYASKVDENTAETFDSALDDGKYALLKDGRKGLIETTPGGLVADFLDGSRENITEDMIERPISDEEWLTAQEEEVQPEAEKNQYARQPEAEEVVSAISQETLPENVQQSKQIPVTDDGKPDYNAMSPEMFAEEFEKEFGPEETKAELEKMVTDVEAKIEKLHKKAPTDRNARAENKREILRLTKEKESVLQALERYIVKEEGQKDEQPFFSDEEEVVRWVIENSDDVNEVLGTYEAVKGLQGDITLPRWKQELQGVKINPESFYKESDRNLVTSELKRGWLSRDGRNIDEIAHELSDYGIEVTPQDIVDFMLENPSGHVRRKSSELDALEQRFSELATKVAGIKIGKPDSPTGKLFIKNLRTDSNMDQLREQINDLQRAEEEVLRSMAEQREAERKNEEIREEDSDLFRKSITLQENEKNNSNEISEQISQGEYGAEVKENGRVEEALIELRRRSEEDGGNAQEAGRTLSGRQQKEIEARAAEDYAKEKGIWIPMQNIFSLGEPAPSGNENDVYFNSQDNSVYKVNNLMNSGSIFSLLERIKLHNQYFPDTRYELVGFSGFGGRDTYPVLRQRYVENSTFATPKEIENYMEALGFERIGDAKYSNGDVVISDLRPRNVLKDSDNDFYVVDAEFEKIKQGNSLKDKEIQSDSEESQEDVSDEVLFREKENYTPEENIEEVNRRFNEELEAFEKGEQKGDLHLGRPGDVLLASGLNNTEMYITPKTLKGHLDKHGLKVDDIKDLPSALREPLFVYEWGDKAKSLVVITNIEHGNERITAAVKLERNGRKLEVNELASVHPKKGGRFVEEMINAKRGGLEEALRNVPDKRKALDWLGLVPPEGTASLTDQELSIANIIQNFENPTFQSGEISSSNDDARYRFIGEKGAANLDKAEEATIRLDHLNVARDMEKVGKDAKAIKLATGWERGADGKWRYEEADFEYYPLGDANKDVLLEKQPWYDEFNRLLDKAINGEKLTEEEEKRFGALTDASEEIKKSSDLTDPIFLNDYVKDENLFKAYPELKVTTVVFGSYPGESFAGIFNENDNKIIINLSNTDDVKSVLAHEIQHAIQHIEGFVQGGNPSMFEKPFLSNLSNFAIHEAAGIRSQVDDLMRSGKYRYEGAAINYAIKYQFERGWLKEVNEDNLEDFRGAIMSYSLKELQDASVDYLSPIDKYTRIAGEVEARNVESRMNMTSEERRNSLASETEDVAREDQIFLNDALGVSASMESNKIEDINGRFNEELQQQINGTLPKGHVYRLGRPGEALRSAGIPNLPIELVASKLSLKASEAYESKHPFDLSAITNLPDAIQNPIAVFDSKTRAGSKVIMTELADSKGNHFVVAMNTNVPSNQYGKKTIQINSIRSVYPKDNVRDIVNWIDRGDLLKWVDKTKLGNWLTQQRSNSADVATPVFELDVAANIIQSFKNPTILEGEILAGIDQLSEDLRVPVKKVQSRKDLPEGIQRQMKNGRYPGLFDPKVGEVYMVMDEITDVADAQATMLHEIVGHKGIRGLFGDKIGAFTQRVLDSMPENEREMWVKKYNGNEQLAAEEYVARFAEGYENPGVWEKIKAVVRELFRDLGIDLKLSDNDLKYILWKAKNKLKEGDGMVEIAEKIAKDRNIVRELWRKEDKEKGLDWISSVNPNESQEISNQDLSSATNIIQNFENPNLGDEIHFREDEHFGEVIEEVNRRFNEELLKFTVDNADKTVFNIGKPSNVLISAGVENKPIKLYGSKVLKKMKKHGFDAKELKDLPKAVADPIAVFNNLERQGNRSILTELKTTQGNFLVTIDLGKGHDADFDVISSVFGKNDNSVITWINKDFATYINREKALEYLHLSAPIAEASNTQELSSATNIIQNFENPKLGDEIRFREVNEEEGGKNKETAERISLLSKLQSQLLNERVSAKLIARKLAGYARNAFNKDLVEVMGKKDFDTVVREIERGLLESKLPKESVELTDERKRLIQEYWKNLGDKEISGKAAKRIREIDQEVNRMAKEALWEPMMRIGDVVAGLELKRQKERLDRLVNLKVEGMNAQGVSVAKKVDEETKVMLHFIRDHIGEDMAGIIEELEKKRDEAEVGTRRFDKKDEATLKAAMTLQQFFASDNSHEVIAACEGRIKELKEDIKELEVQIEEEKQEKTPDKRLLARLRRKVKNKKQEIRYSAFTVIDDRYKLSQKMIRLNDLIEEMIYEGRSSFLDRVNEESIRRTEILREAMRDMDTRTEEEKMNPIDREKTRSNKAMDFIRKYPLSPAWSFNYLVKHLSRNAMNGEGEFYDRLFRGEDGLLEASAKEWKGIQEFRAELDKKVKEIFGKKYDYLKVMEESGKMLEGVSLTVDTGTGGEYKFHPTIGQALYITMIDRMPDAAQKLRAYGISDENVMDLRNALSEEYVRFADWVQDEFLPRKREKYNETHVRIFGSSMAEISHYFPLRVQKSDVYQKADLNKSPDVGLPSGITGSIINRKPNWLIPDVHTNAFEVLLDHGKEMEHWNAYTRVVHDLNGVLSSTAFRKMLKDRDENLPERFRSAATIAVGKYRAKDDDWNRLINTVAKGFTAAKINFRVNTALKQVFSGPAFMAYAADMDYQKRLAHCFMPDMWKENWKWGMENLPVFEKRWKERKVGNEKLEDGTWIDKFTNSKGIKAGMWLNAAIDAMTCVNGARAVYDYKLKQYRSLGIRETEAVRRARIDAELAFNESQQSAEGFMLSKMQKDKTVLVAGLSVFNNSNFLYLRQTLEGVDELRRDMAKEVASRKRLLIKLGVEDEVAEDVALKEVKRMHRTAIAKIGVFGFGLQVICNLGSKAVPYLTALMVLGFGDDDKEKEEAREVLRNAGDEMLKSLLIAPVRNLPGGSDIESMLNGFEASFGDLPMFSDLAKLMKMYKKCIDSGELTPATIYETFRMAGEGAAGVDLNVLANLYLGIEDAVKNGGVRVEDTGLWISAPASQIRELAKRRRADETLEEYIKRIRDLNVANRLLNRTPAWLKGELKDRYRLTPFQRAKKDVKQDVKRKINQVNRNESLSPAEKKVKRESLRKERDKQMEKLEEKYDVVR